MTDAKAALVQVLTLASSSDPAQLSRANSQLEDWEKDPNFWLVLLQIAFDTELQVSSSSSSGTSTQEQRDSVRILAIIRFKNGIDKFWRSRVMARVTVTIPAETKQAIRHALFHCLREPNRTIALQASVSISRIARLDYPRDWPDLFTTLQQAMVEAHANLASLGPPPQLDQPEDPAIAHARQLNTTVLMRAADVCSKTLKELESVRVLAGKMRMTELSRELLPVLHPIFQQYFSEVFSLSTGDDLATLSTWSNTALRPEQVRTSHLLLKAISRLAVADIGMISRSNTAQGGSSANMAQAFFRSTPHCLQTLKDTRLAYLRSLRSSQGSSTSSAVSTALVTALTKHLYSFGKFFLSLVQRDNGKAAFWEGWSEVVAWYWMQAKDVTDQSLSVPRDEYANHSAIIDYPPRFVVQALVLLKYSLTQWKGNRPEGGFFITHDFAREAADVLAGRLMRLNSDDLERWQADPEEWAVGEEQENHELDIRPAAERALMVLAQHTKPVGFVGQHLWQHFEASSKLSTDNQDDVLARDAIYAAVGRCREHLSPAGKDDDRPSMDVLMGQAIANKLIPEARLGSVTSPMWVMIRRRIAWLLWEWSEQVPREARLDVYALLVDLLEDVPDQTDVAVRLAAARSISAIADALEFDADGFEPFLPEALRNLATLAAASDLHEMESIKVCTDALSILIERMGPRIAPHADALVDLVPMLWQQDDPDCKARPSIIVFISKVLRAIEMLPATGSSGALMQKVHHMVSPIVRESLHPKVSHLLAKDAISMLWIRALHSTPTMTQPLFSLLDLAKDLIVQPDYCVEMCRVVEEISLLNPLEMLQTYGQDLLTAFGGIIADPSNPMVLAPISALDTLIQALVSLPNWSEVCTRWIGALESTRLAAALVGSLLHFQDATLIATHFVALLCRIAYHCPGDSFVRLVCASWTHISGPDYPTPASVFPALLKYICSRFENMASARKRRVTALGLASMLDSAIAHSEQHPESGEVVQAVVACTPEMIAVWSEMLAEIKESRPLDTGKYLRPTSPIASMELADVFFDDDDEGGWLQDVSPGAARAQRVAVADGTLTVEVGEHVRRVLAHAQTNPGFSRVVETMDPLVLDMFQKDLMG
ncbi:Importin-beta, N-terminal domain protein [Kalmanozyma brasiliensis GHG001]|uniref:Nuclear transport receptor KAP120 n=1 Tax=Kalmanozyma brasiliensis (strain GHG001) TaxID=1365824 RepID=V5GNH9_KALBG|nr:Importin-beta, N-terminal domain protein [Kalmanozyma brasiliensis GHG001]EST07512.1 Importin-beta, N-terminal domain protein [Kalmanozyma brasiliensis GHG001]